MESVGCKFIEYKQWLKSIETEASFIFYFRFWMKTCAQLSNVYNQMMKSKQRRDQPLRILDSHFWTAVFGETRDLCKCCSFYIHQT